MAAHNWSRKRRTPTERSSPDLADLVDSDTTRTITDSPSFAHHIPERDRPTPP